MRVCLRIINWKLIIGIGKDSWASRGGDRSSLAGALFGISSTVYIEPHKKGGL